MAYLEASVRSWSLREKSGATRKLPEVIQAFSDLNAASHSAVHVCLVHLLSPHVSSVSGCARRLNTPFDVSPHVNLLAS